MNLSDRIQELRKQKGISQEQLAEMLNVSRQAVSKWESNQSLPEVDKLVVISDLFEVSIDYLLKGTEISNAPKKQRNFANIFTAIGTMLITIGLIAAISGWYEEHTSSVIGGGMILQVVGIAMLLMGKYIFPKERLNKALIIMDIWLLIFMPISIVTCISNGFKVSPYPYSFIQSILLFIVLYIIIGVIGTMVVLKIFKKKEYGM